MNGFVLIGTLEHEPFEKLLASVPTPFLETRGPGLRPSLAAGTGSHSVPEGRAFGPALELRWWDEGPRLFVRALTEDAAITVKLEEVGLKQHGSAWTVEEEQTLLRGTWSHHARTNVEGWLDEAFDEPLTYPEDLPHGDLPALVVRTYFDASGLEAFARYAGAVSAEPAGQRSPT